MYDWNRNGKIDMADHWITHQIINAEKEKRKNSTSYPAVKYDVSPEDKSNHGEQKEINLLLVIMIDIVLLVLVCAIK